MADDTEDKPKKTETLAHYKVSDFANLSEWKDFDTKSKAFVEAKDALMVAKKKMVELMRKDRGYPAEAAIDFSVNGNKVTLIHNLDKKKSERAPTVSFGGKGADRPLPAGSLKSQ